MPTRGALGCRETAVAPVDLGSFPQGWVAQGGQRSGLWAKVLLAIFITLAELDSWPNNSYDSAGNSRGGLPGVGDILCFVVTTSLTKFLSREHNL